MSRRTDVRIHPLPVLVLAASLLFGACSGSDDEQPASSSTNTPPTSAVETADDPPLARTDEPEVDNDAGTDDDDGVEVGTPVDANAVSVNDVFDDAGASPDLVACYSDAYEEHAGITELTSFTQLRDVDVTPALQDALDRCVDIANGN